MSCAGALRRVADEHLRPAAAGARPRRGRPRLGRRRQASTSTCSAASPSTRSATPTRRWSRPSPPSCRPSATSRTSSPPSPRSRWPSGCSTLLGSAATARVFFTNSGTEANEAALQADPAHRPHPRGRRRGRLPRPHHGRARADLQGGLPRAVRAAARRRHLRAVRRRRRARRGRHRRDRRRRARADPGRGRRRRAARRLPRRAPGEITREHGALLWLDEVQTGIGRTGAWFAHRGRRASRPDIVTAGQGPRRRHPDRRLHRRSARPATCSQPGNHGTTFGGNPVACAAALAVLDTIERDGLLEHVTELGRAAPRRAWPPTRGSPRSAARACCIGLDLTAAALGRGRRAPRWSAASSSTTRRPTVIRLAPPLVLTARRRRRVPGRLARRSSTTRRRSGAAMTRHFLRDDDLARPSRPRCSTSPPAQAAPYDAQAARRPAHGRDDLRQADAAHPGVVRRRHRRARRLPDARRRRARRHRRARVGRRHRPGARPAGVGDRLADLRPGATRGDGRARRRAGRQRADRRVPPLPAARRPADRPRAQGRARRPDRRLRRRRRLQHGQLLAARRRHRRACTCGSARPRATSPTPAMVDRGQRDRRGRPAARSRSIADPRRGRRPAPTCVVTDTWVSMGKESEAAARLAVVRAPTRVTDELLGHADAGRDRAALPAGLPRQGDRRRRCIDGPQSVVWDEAENRRHAQKAILTWLLSAVRRAAVTDAAPDGPRPRAPGTSRSSTCVDAPRGALAGRARRAAGRRRRRTSPRPRCRATWSSSTRSRSARPPARWSTPSRPRAATDDPRAPRETAAAAHRLARLLRRAAGQRRGERQPGRAAHPARRRPVPRLGLRQGRAARGARHHRRRRHRAGDRPRPARAARRAWPPRLPVPGQTGRRDDHEPRARHRTDRATLWGGRFAWRAGRRELEALSRSTPLRLAADALRPGRLPGPRQRAARGRAAHRRRPRRAARRPRRARASGTPPATLRPDPSDEDVHGALERLLLERGRRRASAAGCAPAARRNDQVATLFKVYLRDHAAGRRGAGRSTWSTRWPTRPRRTSARSCPAARTSSTPSRCCCRHHLLAHAWPLLRDVERLRDWDARVAADSPYGSGALAGSSLGLDPRGGRRASSASPAPAPTRSTAPRPATSSPSSRSWPRMVGVDLSRLAEEVILWSTREFGFVTLARLLVDRVEHHAAEEEPRHRRARPRQGRPADRQPRPGCWPRSRRCRWPTTATSRRTRSRSSTPSTPSRCCCPAFTGMVATLDVRHRPDGRAGAAGLLAGHRRRRVAGPRGRAVPGRPRGRRRLRAALRGARRRAAPTSPTTQLAEISPAPDARGPRRCSPSRARSPPATAAAAPRRTRVREQLAELAGRDRRTTVPPRLTCSTCWRPGPRGRAAAARRGAARTATWRVPAHRGRGVRRRRTTPARTPTAAGPPRNAVMFGPPGHLYSTSPTACTTAPTW